MTWRWRSSGRMAVVVVMVATLTGPLVSPNPVAAQAAAPPTRALARAQKLYHSKKYPEALVALQPIMASAAADTADGQRAELLVGQSLFHMGLHVSASLWFRKIAERGAKHRYYRSNLAWSHVVGDRLPDASRLAEVIAEYDESWLDNPALSSNRGQLAYQMAVGHYRKGRFERALGLLQPIKPDAEEYMAARFLEGVIEVRRYRAHRGLAAWKEILRLGVETPESYDRKVVQRFVTLARLQMARLFYTAHQYDDALDYADSVATLRRLHSPAFLGRTLSATRTLESGIYFERCLYKSALRTAVEIGADYGPAQKEIQRVLEAHEGDTDLFAAVQSLRQKSKRTLAEEVLVTSLDAPEVRSTVDWSKRIDAELERFSAQPKAWLTSAMASQVGQELMVEQAIARDDAGAALRGHLKRRVSDDDPPLREIIWSISSANTGERVATMRASHPMWVFDRGLAGGRNADVPLVLRAGKKDGKHCVGRPEKPADMSLVQPRKGPRKTPGNKGKYDFSDDEIEGDLVPPGSMPVYLDPSQYARNARLYRLRRDFIPEILQTFEDLRASGVL